MPVIVPVNELGKKTLRLNGELPATELDLAQADELIHPKEPLRYDVEVEKKDDGLLVKGELHILLDCECARCLEPFRLPIDLEDWSCLLPWQGEEKVVVVNNCVDLTPQMREDIVLAFPRQPLCGTEHCGTKELRKDSQQEANRAEKSSPAPTPWAELDKLKL